MLCPKCGKQLPEGSLFCTGCGQRTKAASAAAPQLNPPVKKKNGCLIAGLITAALLVGFLALIALIIGAVILIGIFAGKTADGPTPVIPVMPDSVEDTATEMPEDTETEPVADTMAPETEEPEPAAPVTDADITAEIRQRWDYDFDHVTNGYFESDDRYTAEAICLDRGFHDTLTVAMLAKLTFVSDGGRWRCATAEVNYDHLENTDCLLGEWLTIDSRGMIYSANIQSITDSRITLTYSLDKLQGEQDSEYTVFVGEDMLHLQIEESIPGTPKDGGLWFMFNKNQPNQSPLRYSEITSLNKFTDREILLGENRNVPVEELAPIVADTFHLKDCEFVRWDSPSTRSS